MNNPLPKKGNHSSRNPGSEAGLRFDRSSGDLILTTYLTGYLSKKLVHFYNYGQLISIVNLPSFLEPSRRLVKLLRPDVILATRTLNLHWIGPHGYVHHDGKVLRGHLRNRLSTGLSHTRVHGRLAPSGLAHHLRLIDDGLLLSLPESI